MSTIDAIRLGFRECSRTPGVPARITLAQLISQFPQGVVLRAEQQGQRLRLLAGECGGRGLQEVSDKTGIGTVLVGLGIGGVTIQGAAEDAVRGFLDAVANKQEISRERLEAWGFGLEAAERKRPLPCRGIPNEHSLFDALDRMHRAAMDGRRGEALCTLEALYLDPRWRELIKPKAMKMSRDIGDRDFTVGVVRILLTDREVGATAAPQILNIARIEHEERGNLAAALLYWDLLLGAEVRTESTFVTMMTVGHQYYRAGKMDKAFQVWEVAAKRGEVLAGTPRKGGGFCSDNFRVALSAVAHEEHETKGDFESAFRIWQLLAENGFATKSTAASLTNVASAHMRKEGEVTEEEFNRGTRILGLLLSNGIDLEHVAPQVMDAAHFYNETRGELDRAIKLWDMVLSVPGQKEGVFPPLGAVADRLLEGKELDKAFSLYELMFKHEPRSYTRAAKLLEEARKTYKEGDAQNFRRIMVFAYRHAPQLQRISVIAASVLSREREGSPRRSLFREMVEEMAAVFTAEFRGEKDPAVIETGSHLHYVLERHVEAYEIASSIAHPVVLLAKAEAARKCRPLEEAQGIFEAVIALEQENLAAPAHSFDPSVLMRAHVGKAYVLIERGKKAATKGEAEGLLLEADRNLKQAEQYASHRKIPYPRLVAGKAYVNYWLARIIEDRDLKVALLDEAAEGLTAYLREFGSRAPKIARTLERIGKYRAKVSGAEA